jgi:NAD(P)-dependent dehydrogenase (short-subunit alcohol dehydrogenase family)
MTQNSQLTAPVSAPRPLEGRTAIVTGASQGLGVAIARAYVAAGASVMLCARDGALLERARLEIAPPDGSAQTVLAHAADVSRPGDVDRLVAAAMEAWSRVDILVNNAGIHGPIGAAEDVDWEQWVQTIAINLFGSVLMCRALLPHFKARRSGKIVQLSGGGATKPMPRASAYAASKAAVVRFVETLAEEVREYGIDVNAIAPGALNTRMLDDVLAAGPDRAGQPFYQRAVAQMERGGESLEEGAALAVFLASAAGDGITGRLVSAIWDPWDRLAELRDELLRTDVYTLRRIVPADRGLSWPQR